MKFEYLPAELFPIIGSYCAQADLTNLAIACPALSYAVLPGIYQCIVIDPIPRSLYDRKALKRIRLCDQEIVAPITTVHTIAGIKQLLDTLASHPEYAEMVRSLTVKGNVALSDNVLIPRIRKAFQNLTKLSEFEWTACPELPADVLFELPHDANGVNSQLTTLRCDLATRPGQVYPEMRLPFLRRIHIRPFLNGQVLSWLRRIIMDSHDIEEIKLYRFLDSKSQVGSSYAFIGLSDIHQQHEPCAAVSLFFHDLKTRYLLRCLDLVQTDTSANDARHLANAVDLSCLRELKLIGSGQEDEYNHGLLSCIAQARPRIEKLEIDWVTSCLAMHSFLAACCGSVRSLKIAIKDRPFQTLHSLQRSCCEVKCLDIQVHCDFTMSDLRPILYLQKLQVLKIPFNHKVPSWEMVLSLPKLKVIGLSSTSTSSLPSNDSSIQGPRHMVNMGLLTSGTLDQWNDFQRSPLQCANIIETVRSNQSVEYVILDGHVTSLRVDSPALDSYE